MKFIIDAAAGPCPGVKRAIALAEENLHQGELHCIGPLIHNEQEVRRLKTSGLQAVPQESVQAGELDSIRNQRVFIRSHGISEALYSNLESAASELVDATCPIVKTLQKTIKQHYQNGEQIILIGKPGHPEVLGLNGHCNNSAVIVSNETDIDRIDPQKPSFLVSQTTIDQNRFWTLAEKIRERHQQLTIQDTTCRQLRQRDQRIQQFADKVDVLLLVGGKQSSNTGVLFRMASTINPRTFWIETFEDIDMEWFRDADSVGITGSASTPVWQLSDVREKLEKLINFFKK